MSLLTMMRSVFPRIGLSAPAQVVSSTDKTVQQVLALANEEGQELASRYTWQALIREATFTTVASETQGSITTIAGSDFDFILNETIWNRSLKRPVFGPKSPSEWQQLKAQFMNGPWNQYRIRGNDIIFLPVPAAGQDCYFEWYSKNWAANASTWATDEDTSVLSERLMALGVIWRWKELKNLEYAEAFNKYERAVDDATARDGGKPTLNLGSGNVDIFPAVVVPSGNWGV